MHRLLYNGLVKKYETKNKAIEATLTLTGEWSVLDPQGELIIDNRGVVNTKKRDENEN